MVHIATAVRPTAALRCNHEPLLRRSRGGTAADLFRKRQEILQSINEQALRLEKHPDDLEALRSLRRAVHTLKGDAAACGFRELKPSGSRIRRRIGRRESSSKRRYGRDGASPRGRLRRNVGAYSTGKAVSTAKTLQQMIARLAKPDEATTPHKRRAKPKTASSTAKPIASGKNGAKKRTQKTGKAAQPALPPRSAPTLPWPKPPRLTTQNRNGPSTSRSPSTRPAPG